MATSVKECNGRGDEGLLSCCERAETEQRPKIADCIAGAKRHVDFMRHRGEKVSGRRHQVVYGGCRRSRTAASWGLLADGIARRAFGVAAHAGHWIRSLQTRDRCRFAEGAAKLFGYESADAGRHRRGYF